MFKYSLRLVRFLGINKKNLQLKNKNNYICARIKSEGYSEGKGEGAGESEGKGEGKCESKGEGKDEGEREGEVRVR